MRRAAIVLLLTVTAAGCRIVPKNRQRYLNDPTMAGESAAEERTQRKVHTTREGAGGGDGEPAGGGCSCGN